MSDDLPALIARETLWWDSIEFATRQTNEVLPSWAGPKHDRVEIMESYVETRDGRRRYESRIRDSAGHSHGLTAHCFDGTRNTTTQEQARPGLDTPHRQVQVTTSFAMEENIGGTMRPQPLEFFYVGKAYLHQSLERSTSLGQRQVGPFRCQAFEFRDILWAKMRQTIVFSIDADRGIPIRVESFDVADRTRRRWVWEVEELTTVDGHPFPSRMLLVHYSGGTNGTPVVENGRHRVDLVSLAFNKTFPATLFQPTLTPGTLVLDSTSKKDYRIPDRVTTVKTASSETPEVLAIEPSGWGAHASELVFGLGAALVLFGLALRWSRRSTSGA